MIEETLRDWVLCVEAGDIGVGFLINEDTLLTALHNLKGQLSRIKVYIDKNSGKYYFADCIAQSSEYDIAILKLDNPINNPCELELNISWDSSINTWRSFGYVKDLFTNGSKFYGKFLDTTVNESILIYDLHLKPELELNYKGASGAPVIAGNKIIGILIKKLKGNTLGAVSFKMAYNFLSENGIEISTNRVVSLEENNFLSEMINLGCIGYEKEEKIPYIRTLAQWRQLDEYTLTDTKLEIEGYKRSKNPGYDFPIQAESLIEEYFKEMDYHRSVKIAFVVADFGKGKSSFLKYLAKKYALDYLGNDQEYFPIYFNLRWYTDYNDSTDLGCIYLYMKKVHNIDLKDQKYLSGKFLFLIDSLDESGELIGEEGLEKVLNSVKSILTRNGLKYNKDKIILTSRPISHLNKFISKYSAHKDEDGNEYYISLSGFQKEDFDLFLKRVIDTGITISEKNKFSKKITELIKHEESISEFLIRDSIIDMEEISRPIFAYMLYKIICSNQEFDINNKLSIFLSFINLLTKEAKYVKDDSLSGEYRVDEELKHRNILHASAVNWQFKRHINKDNVLKVKELSKILMEKDEERKAEYHQFYSQSYFGENKESFYFKHQSFAEILLAEYYLKVLIYAALENEDIKQTRMKLSLGLPTTQTMLFYQGLLSTVLSSINEEKKENYNSRIQIFPLIGSMIIEEYLNFLNSNELKKRWINSGSLNKKEIPRKLIENWPLDKSVIKKIIAICTRLIEDNNSYTVPIYDKKETIYNSEILIREGINSNEYLPIDKWIALYTIYILVIEIQDYIDLINKINTNTFLEEMAISNSILGHVTPDWENSLLCGLDMSEYESTNILNFENEILQGFDASDSKLSSAIFVKTDISDSYFENAELKGTDWGEAILKESYFNSANLNGAIFTLSHLIDVDFTYSNFLGGHFTDCFIENVRFDNSIIQGSNFSYSKLSKVSFRDCDLQGVNFSYAVLSEIDFDNCELENVIFKKAKISYSLRDKYYNSLIKNPHYSMIIFIEDSEVKELLE